MRKIRETYKDIPGWPGYQVSVRGNVRSLDRLDAAGRPRKGKMLKPSNCDGYRSLSLSKDGKVKTLKVHILVALTFLGPRPEGKSVDHFDENKANNKLCNLSYILIGDNTYRSRMKNMTSSHRGVCWEKTNKKWLAQITIDGKRKSLGRFETELEAVEVIKEFKNNLK